MFSPVGNDYVALDVESGQCFGMADVTADVWRLLEEPQSLTDLAGHLVRIYDVDDAECMEDLTALLDDMWLSGLVTMAGYPSPAL